jgi:hypothetical protein
MLQIGAFLFHVPLYKISVYTSQRTQCASIRKTNRLMLYTEVIAIYATEQNTYVHGGQGADILVFNLAVHVLISVLEWVDILTSGCCGCVCVSIVRCCRFHPRSSCGCDGAVAYC